MDIKSYRERTGLTQADLASRLGVTQSTVSRFETGALAVDARTRLALEAIESALANQSAAA